MTDDLPLDLRFEVEEVHILGQDFRRQILERADVCAVPAAGVVAEACVAFEITKALLEKFGSDSLPELKRNYTSYLKQLRKY